MTIEKLCERLNTLVTTFPFLQRLTWVDAYNGCIRTDANFDVLLDKEKLEKAQKSERDRFDALDDENKKSAITKKYHKAELSRIKMNLIMEEINKKVDFVTSVTEVEGTGGTGVLKIAVS